MAAAHGGQAVVTGATRDSLDGEFELTSLGRLELFRQGGDRLYLGVVHINLGESWLQLGQLEAATASLGACLRVVRELGSESSVAYCVVIFGCIAAKSGHPTEAALLLGAGLNWFEERGWQLQPLEQSIADNAIPVVRATLGDQRFSRLLQAGRELTPDQALEHYQSAEFVAASRETRS